MTVQLIAGMRQYTLLIPVSVPTTQGERTITALHLRPVTWKLERDWQDGLIDGRYGMLEALIARLTVEPYAAIEQLRYPDTDMFRREFLAHLSPAIAGPIGRGEYPTSAAPAPDDDPPEDDDGGEPGGDWPDEPTPDPRPSTPVADDPRMMPAEIGPEESLGSPEQQRAAAEAFAARRDPPDPYAEAREMVGEPSPLATAVQRSQQFEASPRQPFAPPPDRQEPVRRPGPPPIPRDTPAPVPTASVPPPPLNLTSPGAPAREPVYNPANGYKPDMQADSLGQALGIGDVT